ncbi:MAG: hypothetical protein C4305_08250 [Thermoleophilia bacterium]
MGVGGVTAGLGLVADAIDSAQSFVRVFVWVYTLLIFAYVISTWFRGGYSLNPVMRFLRDVCPPLGPIDLSPIVAVAALYVLQWVVTSVILERLH